MTDVNGIIVMTAMPPTHGHAYLIQFARNYIRALGEGTLNVIVCARPFEPISGADRLSALREHFWNTSHVNIHRHDGNDPQEPDETHDFWDRWVNIVTGLVAVREDDILFASETYGAEFAKHLGCRFQPCDVDRGVVDIKATYVREDPLVFFDNMIPEFSRELTKTVTFFGVESSGKTTMSRQMADEFSSHWVHEWARPYLELCGPQVTDSRMADIVHGQYAAQRSVASLKQSPFIMQDTDLLSTLGYYRIYGGTPHPTLGVLIDATPSDLYIVMNSKVPFVPDPLRYGGDKRESTDEFWLDLLREFRRPVYYVQSVEPYAQAAEIRAELMKLFHKDTDWGWFRREAA